MIEQVSVVDEALIAGSGLRQLKPELSVLIG